MEKYTLPPPTIAVLPPVLSSVPLPEMVIDGMVQPVLGSAISSVALSVMFELKPVAFCKVRVPAETVVAPV